MEWLLELTGLWIVVVVGLLAMAESGLYVGLIVPGETVMLLGGVLAAQGRATLVWVIVAAYLGGVVGDSISSEVGRRFGPRPIVTRLGGRVGDERWDRAGEYVRDQGRSRRLLGSVRRALPRPRPGRRGMGADAVRILPGLQRRRRHRVGDERRSPRPRGGGELEARRALDGRRWADPRRRCRGVPGAGAGRHVAATPRHPRGHPGPGGSLERLEVL